MKRAICIFLLSVLFTVLVFADRTFAATPTPTNSLLEQLSNEIASKTAALNLVEKRGIIGIVTDTSDTQITLNDLNGNTRFIDVDELTKFSSSTTNTFGISDITKGMRIGVLGLYNKQSRRILARDITEQSLFPAVIYGEISLVDKTNFEITITKADQQKIVIEIQDITKTYSYSADTLIKSGFSKTNVDETAIAIGFPDKQDPNKILGSRVILLPDIQLNYNTNVQTNVNPTIPPSTGSGVKLYPIVK